MSGHNLVIDLSGFTGNQGKSLFKHDWYRHTHKPVVKPKPRLGKINELHNRQLWKKWHCEISARSPSYNFHSDIWSAQAASKQLIASEVELSFIGTSQQFEMKKLFQKIESYSDLPQNWGARDSRKIEAETRRFAKQFLQKLVDISQTVKLPSVAPVADGSINFCWRSDDSVVDLYLKEALHYWFYSESPHFGEVYWDLDSSVPEIDLSIFRGKDKDAILIEIISSLFPSG